MHTPRGLQSIFAVNVVYLADFGAAPAHADPLTIQVPAPEPSNVAVMLMAIAGLAAHRTGMTRARTLGPGPQSDVFGVPLDPTKTDRAPVRTVTSAWVVPGAGICIA